MMKDFYLTATLKLEQTQNNMLKNVTKSSNKAQLLKFTCFSIHVGPYGVGEKAYA